RRRRRSRPRPPPAVSRPSDSALPIVPSLPSPPYEGKSMRIMSTFLVSLVLVAASTQAQVKTRKPVHPGQQKSSAAVKEGIVEGWITDANGTPVTGAAVTIVTPAGESKEAVSDSSGKYHVGGLAAGPNELHVKAPGFAEFKSEGFNAQPGPND